MEQAEKIGKLQRQAAACTDELLEISGEIGAYIVDAYGKVPQEMFDLQCRMLRERCRNLAGRLRGIRAGLGEAADPKDREESLAVTGQMIAQNLVILEQKERFLTEFLAHSGRTGMRLKEARELSDLAGVARLANILKGELDQCRREDKK